MDDVLQALAKMLNMTTDEVSSLLTIFKGNAPKIYEALLKEKMFYDVFGFFENISLVTLMFKLLDIHTEKEVWDSLFDCIENCNVYLQGNVYENKELLEVEG